MGHIARDCPQFFKVKGNLKQYFKKLYKEDADSEHITNDEVVKENPVMVSVASSNDYIPRMLEDVYEM